MTIYETITTCIWSQLEAGQSPQRKTRKTGLPKSLTNDREVRALNALAQVTQRAVDYIRGKGAAEETSIAAKQSQPQEVSHV